MLSPTILSKSKVDDGLKVATKLSKVGLQFLVEILEFKCCQESTMYVTCTKGSSTAPSDVVSSHPNTTLNYLNQSFKNKLRSRPHIRMSKAIFCGRKNSKNFLRALK